MGNAAEHQKKQMQMASASASADGDGDRLRSINDELRHNAGASSPWLPLESNPEVFTQFAHSVGLPSDWGWHDVYGLEFAENSDIRFCENYSFIIQYYSFVSLIARRLRTSCPLALAALRLSQSRFFAAERFGQRETAPFAYLTSRAHSAGTR